MAESDRRRRKGARRKDEEDLLLQQQRRGGQAKRRRKPRHAVIRALNHEVRRNMLRILHARKEPCSPVMLSRSLGISVSKASYHVAILADDGTLEIVDRKQVRGAIEHFYVSLVSDDPTVLTLLEETRKEDEASLK
jgi:DNA-binding transcriptional ArsR family regulator